MKAILFWGINLYSLAFGINLRDAAELSPKNDLIGFFKIEISEDGATLLEATTRPGHLKNRRQSPLAPDPYYYTVTTTAGEVVWQDSFEDPLNERVEYIDESGNFVSQIIKNERKVVYLRARVSTPGVTLKLFYQEDTDRQLTSKSPLLLGAFQVEVN